MCDKQSYRDAGYTPRKPDTPITEQDYEDPLKNWKTYPAPPKKWREMEFIEETM